MKTQVQKDRIAVRLFAAFLAIVMFALTMPVISFAEENNATESGVGTPVQPITMGSIPSEEYYRLLYANNVVSSNSTIYDFEKNGFNFEEVSYNDTLTKSLYYANLGLKVLSFVPYVGGFAKTLAGFV